MIFGRNRVDEDLERIKRANMPEKYGALEDLPSGKRKKKTSVVKTEDRVGAKDILAMIIAVFSLVLPYVIVFVAVMALVILGFSWLWG